MAWAAVLLVGWYWYCCIGCDDRAGSAVNADAVTAEAVGHEVMRAGDVDFDVVRVDPGRASLRLFWKTDDDRRFLNATALEEHLGRHGQRLLFATNAGIFHPSLTPVGLHVEDRAERVPLNTADGAGNFFLKPNGTFAVDRDFHASITETTRYTLSSDTLLLAIQSGPLLVRSGTIHPSFRANSDNRRVRSAVGVASQRRVAFVLSKQPVTFHALATFMRDDLGCPDALYLDGVISKFYLPNVGPDGGDGEFAGLLAVVEGGNIRTDP